ncbi:MAG: enoyl-CoA hydratase, partial [Proteobacteria bacterium]|nr:enoyl-CoA hydratase [Pseudomonadota bacterium]
LIGLSRAREMAFTGAPISAQQAYEWGLVNHVISQGELLSAAKRIASDICACVPEVLKQYQELISEGYSMPLDEALAWENKSALDWASHATADAIEQRRQSVLKKGRREKETP